MSASPVRWWPVRCCAYCDDGNNVCRYPLVTGGGLWRGSCPVCGHSREEQLRAQEDAAATPLVIALIWACVAALIALGWDALG